MKNIKVTPHLRSEIRCSLSIYFSVLSVVVIYEGCGEAIEVGAALASPTTHLLPLPCGGGGGGQLVGLRLPSTSSLSPYPPVVVIASCPVITTVTSNLGSNNNTVVEGAPSVVLPVPTSNSLTCRAHRQATRGNVMAATHPIERALNILLSWMTYHSWKTLNVLYDRSLESSTFAFFREY